MKQRDDDIPQLSGYAAPRQLILEELDTEIHVRERLQETVESRIAWATRLQSSLGAVAETQGPGTKADITSASAFQLAAADALTIAEAPFLPLLSREARFRVPPTLDVTPAPSVTPSTNLYARSHTRHTRLRRSPSTIRTPPKFLYFRDGPTSAIARLLCPDCSRGDFPRVQSLLNHCRIQHGREFGSHDECIRGCAVQVSMEEEAWVIENGSELRHGGLPSLRRLFEIAVGSSCSSLELASASRTSPAQPSDAQEEDNVSELEPETPQAAAPAPSLSSTHLSRTLGHHAETPALAPFLGRAPKRRGITVHDENIPVDIDGGGLAVIRRRWNKPFMHRSRARPTLDVANPAETPIIQQLPSVTPVPQGTRFHIVARVTISDRSLWIPVDRRSATSPDHTHQWWLCVGAPTYSLPISSILMRVAVTNLSPGTSPLDAPLEMSNPPFFVGGTTAHPFLARLRFEWTSGSLNPPLEVDHWVELDMLRAGVPALGDEQVLDIELDRHTVFRPVAEPTQGSDPWNLYCEAPRIIKADPVLELPAYVILLRSLVPKFPLILRDIKNATFFPYKRVSSPAHFRALVPGRRKAIEWARARALREAYEKLREEKAPGDDYPYLTTGDIFSWLADTGLSLRQTVPRSAPANTRPGKRTFEGIISSAVDTFCAACGFESVGHLSAQDNSWEESSGGSCGRPCRMSRLPLLDMGPIARAQSHRHPIDPVNSLLVEKASCRWSIREILSTTDPSLIFAVRCIIAPLELSCFPKLQNTSIASAGVPCPNSTAVTTMVDGSEIVPRSDLATSSEALSISLASSAMLALAVRGFARRLVNSAVIAFASDCARAKGGPRAVLSPGHVSRGVAGSFLTRGDLADIPLPPLALAVSTLVHSPSGDFRLPTTDASTSCEDLASLTL
ncbi:hypothetical protein F5148DRAFT_502809 [Russula earlei]|uniref:Uncharacterized protein n=1 Tax=Russula earlei TaxID=71964 RepID=A0ACC0TX39_9AGAM|nr:hypothetical protein F5148DRAFT_502809 [Russula earlei]